MMTRSTTVRRAVVALAAAGGIGAIGCGGPVGSDVTETSAALSISHFPGWGTLGGPAPSGRILYTPAMWSSLSGGVDQRMVTGLGWSDFGLYQQYGIGFSGVNGGRVSWSGWQAMPNPPTGNCTAPPSQEADWTTADGQTTLGAIACAYGPAPTEPSFWVNILVSSHGQTPTWYRTSWNQTMNSDIALVYSAPYLHLVTAQAFTGGYLKYYWRRNDVSQGYNNDNWERPIEVPGGGQFHQAPSAAPMGGNGGLLIVGVGTDDHVYMTGYYGGTTWDNAWYIYGSDRTFRDTVRAAGTDGSNYLVAGLGMDRLIYESTINIWSYAWDGWNQMPRTATGLTFWRSPTISIAAPNVYDLAAPDVNEGIWIGRFQ